MAIQPVDWTLPSDLHWQAFSCATFLASEVLISNERFECARVFYLFSHLNGHKNHTYRVVLDYELLPYDVSFCLFDQSLRHTAHNQMVFPCNVHFERALSICPFLSIDIHRIHTEMVE